MATTTTPTRIAYSSADTARVERRNPRTEAVIPSFFGIASASHSMVTALQSRRTDDITNMLCNHAYLTLHHPHTPNRHSPNTPSNHPHPTDPAPPSTPTTRARPAPSTAPPSKSRATARAGYGPRAKLKGRERHATMVGPLDAPAEFRYSAAGVPAGGMPPANASNSARRRPATRPRAESAEDPPYRTNRAHAGGPAEAGSVKGVTRPDGCTCARSGRRSVDCRVYGIRRGSDRICGAERGLVLEMPGGAELAAKSQAVGASSTDGMDGLLGRGCGTLVGLAGDGETLESRRLGFRSGYGFPAFEGWFTTMPPLGLTSGTREYRVGCTPTSIEPLSDSGEPPMMRRCTVERTKPDGARERTPPSRRRHAALTPGPLVGPHAPPCYRPGRRAPTRRTRP